MKVGKMLDGKLVQIVRTAETVQFSTQTGWIFICYDFHKAERKKESFKWIPITTEFVWVKEFVDSSSK